MFKIQHQLKCVFNDKISHSVWHGLTFLIVHYVRFHYSDNAIHCDRQTFHSTLNFIKYIHIFKKIWTFDLRNFFVANVSKLSKEHHLRTRRNTFCVSHRIMAVGTKIER